MRATRVTIALNARQNQRAPFIIPANAPPASLSAIIFKAAQTKLRLKKPLRIFVAGGRELTTEDDWKTALREDMVLFVSAGEDYVGARLLLPDVPGNPGCPIHILARQAPVDELAIAQLATTARTLPGMVYAAAQPDLCPGTKYPVGAVFVSQNWIHPPLIGSDIGCGMAWYKTKLSRDQVDGHKGRKIAERLRGVEGPWRTQADRELWLQDDAGSCSAGQTWDAAVGTIGAGNHFAEIQVVESLIDDTAGLKQDDVILLVHSGSRGYGGSILKKYTSERHISLEAGSEEMKQYMRDHDRALRWAKANRELIALRFLSCLEPGDEACDLGRNITEDEGIVNLDMISLAKAKLRERRVVDIWHNNLERARWPPRAASAEASMTDLRDRVKRPGHDEEQIGRDDDDFVFIHRKGAAPTYDPMRNAPLKMLPLPGSRGTPTMMLKPVFSERTAWGLRNGLSVAHGSGRCMSRAKALSSLSQKYKKPSSALGEPRAGEGTWVICDEKDLIFEEAPEAYKDVYAVSEDLVREGAAEVVGWCKPRVSYKVRNEAR